MQSNQLTNEAKRLIAEVVERLNGNDAIEVVDEINEFGAPLDATMDFTRDRLDAFTLADMNEGREVEGGDGFRIFEGVQPHKGDRRRDVGVVECGDFRVTISI